jgi:hypothetical protein
MKAEAYARKVNTGDELLRRILDAARRINNAAVLRKFTRFLFTCVGKCVQADGGHFQQIAWAVKHITLTAQLTTIFSEHAMYFLLLYFIQFTVNTHSSVNVANRTHVCDVSNSKLPLILDPEVLTTSPGTLCILPCVDTCVIRGLLEPCWWERITGRVRGLGE